MSAWTGRAIILAAAVLFAGCANFNSGAVRNLTSQEIEVLTKTRDRLQQNQTAVRQALDSIADQVEYALGEQYTLTSNIARAQLLEAMRSPWSDPNLTATQKEVALYHLFELSEAEQAALVASVEARRANIAELKKSYGQLVSAMSSLIGAQEQLLVHLNQPASTQISLFMQQVLSESQAFRDGLDDSDDPRLQRLAATVAEREEDIARAEARIVALLTRLEEE